MKTKKKIVENVAFSFTSIEIEFTQWILLAQWLEIKRKKNLYIPRTNTNASENEKRKKKTNNFFSSSFQIEKRNEQTNKRWKWVERQVETNSICSFSGSELRKLPVIYWFNPQIFAIKCKNKYIRIFSLEFCLYGHKMPDFIYWFSFCSFNTFCFCFFSFFSTVFNKAIQNGFYFYFVSFASSLSLNKINFVHNETLFSINLNDLIIRFCGFHLYFHSIK